MKFYHGTQNGELKKLLASRKSTREKDEGNVYLTDDYGCAFMYAACSIRSFFVSNGKLCLREVAPDAFKKMYSGHGCYIFTIEVDGARKVKHITDHVYVYDKDIELDPNKREWVEDCYQKMLELEKQGVIGVLRWDDMTKEEQDRRKEHNIQGYKPYMKIEKEKFPEEYKLLVSFYPELAVED